MNKADMKTKQIVHGQKRTRHLELEHLATYHMVEQIVMAAMILIVHSTLVVFLSPTMKRKTPERLILYSWFVFSVS